MLSIENLLGLNSLGAKEVMQQLDGKLVLIIPANLGTN